MVWIFHSVSSEKTGKVSSFQEHIILSLFSAEENSGNIKLTGCQLEFIMVIESSFTNYEINMKKGDAIYIFSDGLPDQFGGPENAVNTKKQI